MKSAWETRSHPRSLSPSGRFDEHWQPGSLAWLIMWLLRVVLQGLGVGLSQEHAFAFFNKFGQDSRGKMVVLVSGCGVGSRPHCGVDLCPVP